MGVMGSKFTKLFRNVETRIIMVGLDAAGKTTILYKLKLGEVITTIPTIGFNVEQAQYKQVQFTVWDVGGRGQVRPLWRHYMQDTSALVFVLDSNDRERITEAKEEIDKMVSENLLREVPVLILANKQDLPNAMSVSEITEKLELHTWRNRTWFIQATAASSGDGLYEGLDWLSQTIMKNEVHQGVSGWIGSWWSGSKTTEKETQKVEEKKKPTESTSQTLQTTAQA